MAMHPTYNPLMTQHSTQGEHAPNPATQLVELARRFDTPIRTANLPVSRASTVVLDSIAQAQSVGPAAMAGELHATTYATAGTPTTFALMDAIAAMEGGPGFRAALMPSGLAAITTALLAWLKPGDHMLVTDSVYGPTRVFCDGMLKDLGIAITYFDPLIGLPGALDKTQRIEHLIQPNTKMLYLESPGSYTFELQDVRNLCAAARKAGVLTMIDTAWSSPLLARPFDWGVDIVTMPLTKYWSGHSDVLMGAAVVREALWPKLWGAVRQLGMCVGGDDAFLILRGMRTLDVRLERHQRNALQVAQWLQTRDEVVAVLYPALPDAPQHALWKQEFQGACGLFGIELKAASPAQVAALCDGRRHFGIGYSWGGYESLIMPARLDSLRKVRPWRGGPLVRLHIGLEDPQDLIADLEAGFAAMRALA
jgi:cysteine-S-conjugate beta-lyase